MDRHTLRRIRFLIGLVTLVLTVSCLTHQLSAKETKSQTPSKEAFKQPPQPMEPIHLALVIHRLRVLNEAVTMLKSLLYFHGQFDHNSSLCSVIWTTPLDVHCDVIKHGSPRPLVLHLVVHRKAWRKTRDLMSEWNSTWIRIKMYPFKLELSFPRQKIQQSRKVQMAIQQLMLPYILDHSVSKAISLSPGLIFNERVENLWAHFDQFSSQQAIGAACEQVDNCYECCPLNQDVFPTYGLNTALRLLHLERLREINWRRLYRMEMGSDQYVNERPGDFLQGITNTILSKRMSLLYPLPCEWNVQAKKSAGLKSCPVYWIERTVFTESCRTNSTQSRKRSVTKMALVLQNWIEKNVSFAVEDDDDESEENASEIEKANSQKRKRHEAKDIYEHNDPLRAITLHELRIRFLQVYNKFQILPVHCFTPLPNWTTPQINLLLDSKR